MREIEAELMAEHRKGAGPGPVRFRDAFGEHAAHVVWRRDDRSLAEKRAHVQKLLVEYGFTDCVSAPKR